MRFKKDVCFLIKIKMIFQNDKRKRCLRKNYAQYLENPNRCYYSIAKELQLKKKVQEPAAESCTTILFLKISVLLKTMKLTLSTIIIKLLGLSIIFPNIEEKKIRNLNTQSIVSLVKKSLDLATNLQL